VKLPLVVVGLRAEARVAAGPDVRVVVGGCDGFRLARAIDDALRQGVSGVMSLGLSGGLAPGLRPGVVVIARSVLAGGGQRFDADVVWSQNLASALPGAIIADIAGVDRPVGTAAAKQELHAVTGAATVDMESHIAARAASRHSLPFASVRVVADPSDCDLPAAALVAMSPDGGIDAAAVMRSLLHHPEQLLALIRTGIRAAAAFRALRAARRDAGAFLALQNPNHGN
jgi:adenosylhomocysteine nucleosidase